MMKFYVVEYRIVGYDGTDYTDCSAVFVDQVKATKYASRCYGSVYHGRINDNGEIVADYKAPL